jgi:hypothetical protein
MSMSLVALIAVILGILLSCPGLKIDRRKPIEADCSARMARLTLGIVGSGSFATSPSARITFLHCWNG